MAVLSRASAVLPFDARDCLWLGLAVTPAVVACLVYLATNPYPAHGAGLYVKIGGEIAAAGYRPPARIPGYTAEGVPFAYPPLQFYVLAALLDLGLDPIAVARYLPGAAVVAAQVPTYLLGRDLLDSRPAGAVAATAVALNPQILEWHVTAGGVVRAFAFLYALSAIYVGYRVFADGNRRAVAVGIGAVALTGLTHPTYALFVVASYLLLWATLDRSWRGLLAGAAVGFGALAVASPWIAWVVVTHGPGVFAAAAGTHGGVGGGLVALVGSLSPYSLVGLALAVALLAARRSVLLPAWFVTTEALFRQPRFAYTVAALLLPAVGLALLDQRSLPRWFDGGSEGGRGRRAVAVAGLLLVATTAGGTVLAHEMTRPADPSTPEYLDDDAVAAMAYLAEETPPDATVVGLGDAAEWLPALTDRTLLIGPWGVEWDGADRYDRQLRAYETVADCRTVDCVEATATSVDVRPDYVYVPKGQYTIRGERVVRDGGLERSFDRSPDWAVAFENDGVVVYQGT